MNIRGKKSHFISSLVFVNSTRECFTFPQSRPQASNVVVAPLLHSVLVVVVVVVVVPSHPFSARISGEGEVYGRSMEQ